MYVCLKAVVMNKLVFVVEDDAWYSEIVKYILISNNFDVHIFNNATDCINNLHQKPAIITLDLSLPDMETSELQKKIVSELPETPIIIISGEDNITFIKEILNNGVYDFITKNEKLKLRLGLALKNIKVLLNLREECTFLYKQLNNQNTE